MPQMSKLESKALWLLAEHGASHPPLAIQRDLALRAAGERALGKIWSEHLGLQSRSRFNDALGGFLCGLAAGSALVGLVLL